MCEVEDWVCYDSCRISIALSIKASDIYWPFKLRSWIHYSLSVYAWSTTFKAISPGGWGPFEYGLCIPLHHVLHSILVKQWSPWIGYINQENYKDASYCRKISLLQRTCQRGKRDYDPEGGIQIAEGWCILKMITIRKITVYQEVTRGMAILTIRSKGERERD